MAKLYTLHFSPEQLLPYINWIYFFHTWGFSGKHSPEAEKEKEKLQAEAIALIHRWHEEGAMAHFRFGLFPCRSHNEEVVLNDNENENENSKPSTIAFLRQQTAPYLCLADFINPKGDTIGVFASTFSCQLSAVSEQSLLEQTTADRLSEAAAELGHLCVRKEYWGYAPDENLTPEELFAERFQGIRPAVGYPCLPDQSLNFQLDSLIDFSAIGITLTESGAMIPHSSTSGLMISLPEAHYFSVGQIDDAQRQIYAQKRGLSLNQVQTFLP